MLHMNESTRTPRTCFEPQGIACLGGCNFLIIPGRNIWPGHLCDLCDQHQEKTMPEDFRVTYFREQLRASSAARIAKERMMRAVWIGVALGLIGASLQAMMP